LGGSGGAVPFFFLTLVGGRIPFDFDVEAFRPGPALRRLNTSGGDEFRNR